MLRFAWVIAVMTIASSAGAEPAFEMELRYANGPRAIAGREFRTGSGDQRRTFDGRIFNVDTAGLQGGEVSFFGRGNRWAFGPMVGLLMGRGPTLPWTGSSTLIVNARMGFEGRATLSRDRFTGWVGVVAGLSILSVNSGVHRVVPTCSCPTQGTHLDFLFEPRIGLEYAVAEGARGRIALGGWAGAEPIVGSWTAGLSFSARMNFVPGRVNLTL